MNPFLIEFEFKEHKTVAKAWKIGKSNSDQTVQFHVYDFESIEQKKDFVIMFIADAQKKVFNFSSHPDDFDFISKTFYALTNYCNKHNISMFE